MKPILAILLSIFALPAFGASVTVSNLITTNLHALALTLSPAPPILTCDSLNDSSLKAYWTLDEASGNAVDSTGAHTLTDHNSAGTTTGMIGNSRTFSSADNTYFSVADNADLGGCNCDLFLWAVVNATGSGSAPTVMSKLPSSGNYEYDLVLDNSGTPAFKFYVSADGTALNSVTSSTNVGAGWHLVCAWVDATGTTINLQMDNGVVDSVPHVGGIFDGTGDFMLGRDEANGGNWNGAIDEAGVTKRIPSAAERTALFNSKHFCRPTFP